MSKERKRRVTEKTSINMRTLRDGEKYRKADFQKQKESPNPATNHPVYDTRNIFQNIQILSDRIISNIFNFIN